MDQWQTTLLIIKMARDIRRQYGATSKIQEAEAIHEWVKNHVDYVGDPDKAEMLSDPVWMIQRGGDCDDMAVLAGALLGALGHKTYFAAVKWKGRPSPTHAVCYDESIRAAVDPVAEGPQQWPPEGYEVDSILIRKNGQEESLQGMFGKAFKKITKVTNKIIKPKTVIGKIVDPLGLTSRNLKWGQKIADVVGTAALVAGTGYGIGAAARAGYLGAGAAGTASGSAGFWNTAWTGAKVIGTAVTGGYAGSSTAAAAGTAAASGTGFWATASKTFGPMLLTGIMSGGGGGMSSSGQPIGYGNMGAGYYDPTGAWIGSTDQGGGYSGDASSYGGSGGGGGTGYDPGEEGTRAPGTQKSYLPLVLAGVAAFAILGMTRSNRKRRGRK
jgi:hypothetical protein